MISNFAPVLIPTLNRFEHFKRCIESLAKCTHSDKTDLFIALDYPSKPEQWKGYNEICNYIKDINDFSNIFIIKREENYGIPKNILDARERIFEKYERCIYSEDDNEFSCNFLDYINKGLDLFEEDKNVLAICGYNIDMELKDMCNQNYYFRRGLSAWGYGTWRKKWINYNYDHDLVSKHILKIGNGIKAYKRNPQHLLSLLFAIKSKNSIFGDIGIGMYQLIHENIVSVYPTLSKVRNWGHDGSGLHCTSKSTKYSRQIVDNNCSFEFIQALNEKIVKKRFKRHYAISLKAKLYLPVLYLFLKFKYFFYNLQHKHD